MLKKHYLILFFFISIMATSQSAEGYWDNTRTTNETISLKAGEKKHIKTSDFPTGTTEIVYRITLLDDNQKTSSSLVSLLKSIPDPTGISQGSAGAVFLASTIAGDDKCKYAVFINSTDADNYVKSGETQKACIVQDEPVNKDAKLVSLKSQCLTSETENLWFAFESDNFIMNQKVVLEVVPWINKKASRGWSAQAKNELIEYTKNLKVYNTLTKKDQFSACFIEAVAQKFTYKEYYGLVSIEKNNVVNGLIEDCLKKIGEIKKLYAIIRQNADQQFNKGNVEEAITMLQTDIFDKNRAEAIDYDSLGRYYLLTKQFDKSQKIIVTGIEKDSSELKLQLDLAHLYLFMSKVSEAKEIHKKYAKQNISSKISWTEQTQKDFELFRKFNLPSENFNKIIRILE